MAVRRVKWDAARGLAMWMDGASSVEIAEAVGMSQQAINAYARNHWPKRPDYRELCQFWMAHHPQRPAKLTDEQRRDRDARIYWAHLRGDDYKDIGAREGISLQRAQQIFERERVDRKRARLRWEQDRLQKEIGYESAISVMQFERGLAKPRLVWNSGEVPRDTEIGGF